MTQTYDAVVIGGGSAGLAFSKRAASHGVRIAMVEKAELGGTCVNRGCVPKKMLWHIAHVHRTAAAFGRTGELDAVPHPRLDRAHEVIGHHIEGIRENYLGTIEERGIDLVRGEARITEHGDEVTVEVDDRVLRARAIVIACGTEPARPDIPGIDLTDTSDDAFAWTEAPERLLIIGGGYIGVEFATVMAAFGSDVTIVETGDDILDGFDPDAVALARRHLERDKVTIITNAELESVERSDNDLVARFEGAEPVRCDKVLVATGRKPRAASLGPVVANLETAENGTLAVDEAFQTSRPGIYAVGDAADRMPLTPVARRDGDWLADHLFGNGETGPRLDLDLVATSTFCDPPIAQVGKTHASDDVASLHVDRDEGAPLEDGLLEEEDGPRDDDISRGASRTLYKLLTDGKGGALRGAVLVSRTAPDEIAWAAAAIEAKLDLRTLRRPAPVHPTFAEEFMG